MFRYKKSVPVSYERQGYIYFASRLYRELTEEQQRLNRVLKEEAVHHTAELQQARVLWLALQQELARCRQEKELAEKECVRVECALRGRWAAG